MLNLALYRNGSRPYVSSISYNHHASRINDGTRPDEQASTSDTAWASASERLPQWAAVVFPRFARVDRVVIYWGKGPFAESSRRVEVQGRVDGAWVAIAAVNIPKPEPETVSVFDPVQVEAVRIWQNADGGPESTPGRIHVAQLEAYARLWKVQRWIFRESGMHCERNGSAITGRRGGRSPGRYATDRSVSIGTPAGRAGESGRNRAGTAEPGFDRVGQDAGGEDPEGRVVVAGQRR